MTNWTDIKIKAAIEAVKRAGGQTALARLLNSRYCGLGLPLPGKDGFTQDVVLKWTRNGIPPKYALHIETLVGVSRHQIAPEAFCTERGKFVA